MLMSKILLVQAHHQKDLCRSVRCQKKLDSRLCFPSECKPADQLLIEVKIERKEMVCWSLIRLLVCSQLVIAAQLERNYIPSSAEYSSSTFPPDHLEPEGILSFVFGSVLGNSQHKIQLIVVYCTH